jgi:hypothetical protein
MYKIGIAGVAPESFPLIGVIYYVGKFLPLTCIAFLFLLELRFKHLFYRVILASFTIGYLVLDMLAGWKASPIRVALILFLIFYFIRGFTKKTLIVLVISGILVGASFILIQQYRKSIQQIYGKKTSTQRQFHFDQSVVKIFHRLAGGMRGALAVTEYARSGGELLTLKNLFFQNPGAVQFTTRKVFKVPQRIVVGRTASLWGNLYIYGGIPLVLMGFFIFGALSRMIYLVVLKFLQAPVIIVFYAIFLTWSIQFVMGGLIYRGFIDLAVYGIFLAVIQSITCMYNRKKE